MVWKLWSLCHSLKATKNAHPHQSATCDSRVLLCSARKWRLMTLSDYLVRATAADTTIRALAVVTTGLVEEARQRHKTAPTASAALGRTLTAGLLLGSMLKEDENLSLQFLGDGPLRGIFVDANARGEARGFVYRPRAHLPIREGKLDVGGVVG